MMYNMQKIWIDLSLSQVFEEMKSEILAALSDQRRQQAVDQYRHQLRLLNHDKVEIYGRLMKS